MGLVGLTEAGWVSDFCSTFGWVWDLIFDFWNLTGDLKLDADKEDEPEKSMAYVNLRGQDASNGCPPPKKKK